MTPTEAIASIRASIAAGLSPSLSDIEVLIAECGRVEALERALREIENPIKFWIDNVEEDEKLDMQMALHIASLPSTYQEIAKKAIAKPMEN